MPHEMRCTEVVGENIFAQPPRGAQRPSAIGAARASTAGSECRGSVLSQASPDSVKHRGASSSHDRRHPVWHAARSTSRGARDREIVTPRSRAGSHQPTSPPMASSLAPAVGRPPSASCSCAAAPSFSSPLASPRGAAEAIAAAAQSPRLSPRDLKTAQAAGGIGAGTAKNLGQVTGGMTPRPMVEAAAAEPGVNRLSSADAEARARATAVRWISEIDRRSHLRMSSLALLLMLIVFGAYDALSMQEGVGIDIDADAVEAAGGAELIETFFVEARSLTTLLLVRYAGGVPVAGIVAATMHYVAADSAPPLSRGLAQLLGLTLLLLSAAVTAALIVVAPPRPMWALCTLMVHIFYGYSVLALELVAQVSISVLMAAAGGLIVWNHHMMLHVRLVDVLDGINATDVAADDAASGDAAAAADSPEWRRWMLSLVMWCIVFNVLGLVHTQRRRAWLLRHEQHRHYSREMAREILKEVEACEQMMANLFPPAVRPQLQHYLNPKYDAAIDKRTAIVAREFTDCTFLFAKVVGLSDVVSNSAYEPQLITTLLQDIFDRFDT